MTVVNYYRLKIFSLIILLLVFWQSLRFLPWLQTFQVSNIDHGPSPSGAINPVLITVFYEALCPDSKSFFLNHLLPTVDRASRLVSVSLVPYGKAKVITLTALTLEKRNCHRPLIHTGQIDLKWLTSDVQYRIEIVIIIAIGVTKLPVEARDPILGLLKGQDRQTNEDNFGNISFTCQHGPTECQANKIHACAIMHLPSTKLQVKYISCMIANNIYPQEIGEKCARELSVNWDSILECSQSKKGDLLLKNHGERTSAVRPKITFIPTVLLDELSGNQAAILKNLLKEICARFKTLPAECLPLTQGQSS